MVDRWGESFTFYPHVPAVLHAARDKNITLSLASRTHAPDLARDMLRGLVVTPASQYNAADGDADKVASKTREKPLKALDYFRFAQIYPGTKTAHFRKIQEATRKDGEPVEFRDMLFFDDEARNRNVEVELGVTFWLVRDGVTRDEVDKGVWEWRKRRGIEKKRKNAKDEARAELEG